MGQALRRFVPRAPRYVLRPNDNQMLRFAPNKVLNRSYSTRFLNVSESGLAFLIDKASAPGIGEFIKVEFPVPGGEQIAWFAKVVRLEEFVPEEWWSETRAKDHENDVVVGVQFHQLPDGHKHAIRVHLQDKFGQLVRERSHARRRLALYYASEYGWKILMYGIAALFAFSILYFLAQPGPNYDPKRGSPWGQRFKLGE